MATVLLVLSICIVVVCGSCLVDPSTMGTLLPPVNIPGYGMCPRGYLCPNSDPSNVSTYPRVCPATAECLQVRLGSGFCEPQGTYEPYVCPAGFYCVTAYEKRICPEGYFCPVGTTEPYKCAPIANCPAGTAVSYDYGCLVLVGVLDVVFLAVWLWVMRRRIITTNKCVNNDMRIMDEHGVQLSGWQSVNKGERELLYRAINHRRGPMDGLTFVFSNLSVTIPPKDGEPEKVVLRSVSGTLKPGQVTAVMGPSGAGKTVFFTALLSKLESSWKTTGGLSINGFGPEDYERFRHVIGYVAQDDSLHNEISVADNVWYSSELRLPRSFSEDDRDTLRRIVMNGFGISNLQQATAGTLSGSQKKKCSIAVELASAPAALFLDEPTSALDATAAHDLCKSLTALAQESNMTVVMVIHQPRVEIWDDLDQVLFLAPGGFTVYQGPKSEAMEYFQRELGFQFGTGNPADIIIDGIAEHRDRCIEAWERKLCLGDSARPVDDAEQSPCATAATEMNMTHTDPPRSSCPNPDEPATFLRQIVLSHNRSLLKQSTSLSSLVLDLVLCMIAAAVMASAAVQTRYVGVLVSPYALISPKHIAYLLAMLAMFYQIAVAATTSVTALRSFMGERECYWREMATGGHNRLAYYIGTSLGDIYRIVLTSLHFAVVAYLMFQPLQSFWQFYLIIILIFLCFDSQSSMLSMVLAPSSAPLLVTVAGVFVALLNGYPKIPALNYIGFTFYLTEALMSQEWEYTNNLYNQVMEQYKTDRYGLDLGIVVLIFVIYRAIGFLLLKFSNRDRQR